MRQITLCANAKVNLALDVVGVREDGYHLMDMLNWSVSLSDRLTMTASPGEGFRVSSNLRFLPTGEKNLVWKAVAKLSEAMEVPMPELHCRLEKHIPTQAGLGGGSADAAAALIGCNRLCGFGLSRRELLHIAEQVGADVPFCLVGGSARVRGIGEQILPLRDKTRCSLLIAMPRSGNPTGKVFALLDEAGALCHPDVDGAAAALSAGDLPKALSLAGNLFQQVVGGEQTEQLVSAMVESGALHAAMTGTGAAVFGVFRRWRDALACRAKLRAQGFGAWAAQRTAEGVQILQSQE